MTDKLTAEDWAEIKHGLGFAQTIGSKQIQIDVDHMAQLFERAETAERALGAAQPGVVKPLVWEVPRTGPDEYLSITNLPTLGWRYEVEHCGGRKPFQVKRSRDIQPFAWAETLEQAKAAAYNDLCRILGDFQATPAPSDKIAEAARMVPISLLRQLNKLSGYVHENEIRQIIGEA